MAPEAKAELEGLSVDFRNDPDRLRVKAYLYVAANPDRFPELARTGGS